MHTNHTIKKHNATFQQVHAISEKLANGSNPQNSPLTITGRDAYVIYQITRRINSRPSQQPYQQLPSPMGNGAGDVAQIQAVGYGGPLTSFIPSTAPLTFDEKQWSLLFVEVGFYANLNLKPNSRT